MKAFIFAMALVVGGVAAGADLPGYISPRHAQVIDAWLKKHPGLRLATLEDCDCAEDVAELRRGSGGAWKPQPNYQPYYAVADFDGNGAEDFAVVVLPVAGETAARVIVFLFDRNGHSLRTLEKSIRETSIKDRALFIGPLDKKPKRLLFGAFATEGEEVVISKK